MINPNIWPWGEAPINIRTLSRDIYHEFVNDYLTVAKWAEHKGISEEHAEKLLPLLREISESKHPEA